jgi:hypothetical protein
MGIFDSSSKTNGEQVKKAAYIYAVNDAGAAIVKGTCVGYLPSTGKVVALTTAAKAVLYPVLIAMENVALAATGRFCYEGEVVANVEGSLAVDLAVMPTTAATGGSTLVAFALDAKGISKTCGLTIEIGADTTLTKVLFDGVSGRSGGGSGLS